MNYFRNCNDSKIAYAWFDLDAWWIELAKDLGVEEFRFNDFFGF